MSGNAPTHPSKALPRRVMIVNLLSVLIVGMSGCSSAKSPLVGKWRSMPRVEKVVTVGTLTVTAEKTWKGELEVELELFSDGRVSRSTSSDSIGGTWTVLDDGRVKIEIEVMGTKHVMVGSLRDDQLDLGSAGKFGRIH